MINSSFLFYDLETFGINPQLDRIAQFACIRTNENLEQIEEPTVLYCKISEDYLPDIEACLLTGITPKNTLEKGICEYEFIKQINEIFSVPETCVLGYNNIRFDDEFIRNSLYRNLFDPYKREWANGNSRWDLIDMVRLTHDLRPGNISWPQNEDGNTSFKLEDLAKANHLTNGDSHDALADVKNTVELARLIHDNNPRLFEYCFTQRDKHSVANVLSQNKILVHTSRMLTSEFGCTSLVTPLLTHPLRNNYILSYDLRYDPTSLIQLSTEEIEKLIFVAKDDPLYENRIRIKGIYQNKCPILAPISVLDDESYERLHISREVCKKHLEKLNKEIKAVIEKLTAIYSKEPEYEKSSDDPDNQIYSGGFFSDSDREKLALVHKTKPSELLEIKTKDRRVPEMLFRLKGRNYSESLNEKDKQKWASFCQTHREIILSKRNTDLDSYQQEIVRLLSIETNQSKTLKELLEYSKMLTVSS